MGAQVIDASAMPPPDPVPVRPWMGVRIALLAFGILSTIPLVLDVFGKLPVDREDA